MDPVKQKVMEKHSGEIWGTTEISGRITGGKGSTRMVPETGT